MKQSQKRKTKSITVKLVNGDHTKVKAEFRGGAMLPEEFTSLIMALIETYSQAALSTNTNVQIHDHWNSVFGIFLDKLVPQEERFIYSKQHKEFKEQVFDPTLGQEETPEMKKDNEATRLAALVLTREILEAELGLTPESADILMQKYIKPKGLNPVNEQEETK